MDSPHHSTARYGPRRFSGKAIVMNRNRVVWLIVVAVIVAVVGGASLIVVNNSVQAGASAPSGFNH